MMLVLAGACLSAPNTQFRRTSTGDLERVHGVGTEKTLQMDKRSPAKATQVVPPTEMPGQFGGPARQLPFGLVTPEKPGQYSRVVYNRVPKCGSTSLEAIIRRQAADRRFSFVRSSDFVNNSLDVGEQRANY